MKPWIVALTGASGIIYGVRLVESLIDLGHEVALIVSDAGRLVLGEEMGLPPEVSLSDRQTLIDLFGAFRLAALKVYAPNDLCAPLASGSYPTRGMVVMPCTMSTLGSIASGVSQNLIHRAAECAMKEGRKLVLVPRETPLSVIHLENMGRLARAGVHIVPAMPAFYAGARQVEDLIQFMVGKVLDVLEIPHGNYPRWTGSLPQSARAAGTETS